MQQASFSEIRARHRYLWFSTIYPAVGLSVLKNEHQPCPACGGTDRFRCDDREGSGSYICGQCGAGDGYKLLMKTHNCDFMQAVKIADKAIQGVVVEFTNPSPPMMTAVEAVDQGKLHKIQKLWDSRLRLDDARSRAATNYFIHRGLQLPTTENLAFSPRLATKIGDELHHGPALLAAVRTLSGELRNVQRIFITNDGTKALGRKSKRFCAKPWSGSMRGCSVQIHEAGKRLLVGEGIETCLAGSEMLNIPCWAGLSDHGLEHIGLPPTVDEVIISVDNDDAGRGAASALADRLLKEGRSVELLCASNLCADAPPHYDLADFWVTTAK